MRLAPNQLVELLLPMLDPKVELNNKAIAKGLPAGPGGAKGRVPYSLLMKLWNGHIREKVILVREETSPEDVDGMHKSQACAYNQRWYDISCSIGSKRLGKMLYCWLR
jgi:pyruvate,orthophosphate dikinase